MKPKIITICGSLRFQDKQMWVAKKLELAGNCVLSVIYNPPGVTKENYYEHFTTGDEKILDKMHRVKIDLSDAIYVVNFGGYIGDSTRGEIDYAQANGKEIMWLEEPK